MRVSKFGVVSGACACAILALAACQTPIIESPVPKQDFADYCASCHGVDAKGNGPAAANLAVAPPDLTTLSARNGGEYPLVMVMSQIDGYGRDGSMPEFGSYLLEDRKVLVETSPGVETPAPERLVLMARYLESLQR
ncbi:c-type cytochrome [Meridianimarinicoccus aquatilis]|uniref:C-type cytochrome n=1 Tax=Meridianimarinicoccus aquatilis TaxID=2552766 RepID=A0A4R6AZE5_9RHOB|nr:c-type cytochrome [Fluviibacterium aquatile]QIE41914.1 cytochrome c [Rhodobacteraceae bacterium SC52]TDL87806.1 c-type cytochrome [Fluviibacterium aquatile]